MAEQELTAEQLAEALARVRVRDLLVSSFSTFAQIGWARLDEPTRDLAEARFAIESLRALLPVLEEAAPETVRDLRQVVTNLQLAYAAAASSPAPGGASGTEPQAPGAGAESGRSDTEPRAPEGPGAESTGAADADR